jgi:hypothetical protein
LHLLFLHNSCSLPLHFVLLHLSHIALCSLYTFVSFNSIFHLVSRATSLSLLHFVLSYILFNFVFLRNSLFSLLHFVCSTFVSLPTFALHCDLCSYTLFLTDLCFDTLFSSLIFYLDDLCFIVTLFSSETPALQNLLFYCTPCFTDLCSSLHSFVLSRDPYSLHRTSCSLHSLFTLRPLVLYCDLVYCTFVLTLCSSVTFEFW